MARIHYWKRVFLTPVHKRTFRIGSGSLRWIITGQRYQISKMLQCIGGRGSKNQEQNPKRVRILFMSYSAKLASIWDFFFFFWLGIIICSHKCFLSYRKSPKPISTSWKHALSRITHHVWGGLHVVGSQTTPGASSHPTPRCVGNATLGESLPLWTRASSRIKWKDASFPAGFTETTHMERLVHRESAHGSHFRFRTLGFLVISRAAKPEMLTLWEAG